MQQQLNSLDCDVFSVAFYVDAFDGNKDIGQHYNAEKMRFNFLTCFKNEVFSPLLLVRCVLQKDFLLKNLYFSNMRKSKIPKCSWLIAVNVTSGIIRNVSLSLKTFLIIADWIGFPHIVNLVLP